MIISSIKFKSRIELIPNDITIESIVVRINAESEGGEGRADEFIEKYNLLRGNNNGN